MLMDSTGISVLEKVLLGKERRKKKIKNKKQN